jgi:1-acyl-sn-glycerol-3-phosphate acyltransferase
MDRLRNLLLRAWWLFCQTNTVCIGAALFRFRGHGMANVPRTGGAILACNHQSYFDPVIACVTLPRSITFMARDSLFRFRPFRWLIRSLHAFPVQRGTADMGAMKESLRRLKAGWILLVFPEGTRTRDGSVGTMRGGIALLAARAGVPVIPTLILGAFQAWPRDRAWPRPWPIEVRYGRALPDDIARDPERFGPALEAALAELGRHRRTAYGLALEAPGATPPALRLASRRSGSA